MLKAPVAGADRIGAAALFHCTEIFLSPGGWAATIGMVWFGHGVLKTLFEKGNPTMVSITCPKCGTVNPADAMNCTHCRINLQWALQNIAGIKVAQVSKQKGERENDATGMGNRPTLYLYVGWIAGAFAILILALATSPRSYNYNISEIGGLLVFALLPALLGGGFGGLIGGYLAKDSTLAGQIASAAFFGALGGLLPGWVCITAARY